jgi:indole-3-glycerol phosphate synthase
MTILDEIFEAKRLRVDEAKRSADLSRLSESAREVRSKASPRRLQAALEGRESINIVAEFKRASPSKGIINDLLEPAEAARKYERGGACAISVLTEEDYFKGSLDDLRKIRAAVSLPILRKDFIVDEFQIYEAAAAGADAILLIVAALSVEELGGFQKVAHALGLDALVEVHTSNELEIAKAIGATLIGVNNRDLRTFEVSLDVSRELIGLAPPNALVIAESGLSTRDDLTELRSLGYSGFLIGETLMRGDDPEAALRNLIAEDAEHVQSLNNS